MLGCPGPELVCETSQEPWPGRVDQGWQAESPQPGAGGGKKTAPWVLMKFTGKLPLGLLLNLLEAGKGTGWTLQKATRVPHTGGATEFREKPAEASTEGLPLSPMAETPAKLAIKLPAGVPLTDAGGPPPGFPHAHPHRTNEKKQAHRNPSYSRVSPAPLPRSLTLGQLAKELHSRTTIRATKSGFGAERQETDHGHTY